MPLLCGPVPDLTVPDLRGSEATVTGTPVPEWARGSGGATSRRSLATAALVLVLATVVACQPAGPEFDLLVVRGDLLDGTGTPPRRADVGIVGDRIVAVGELATRTAAETIDASGKVVAPGFIDTQGQSGRALVVDPRAESHLRQGITSELIGEGSTPALWTAATADSAALAVRGLVVDWSGFGAFLTRLASHGMAINVGSFVPVNQLRADVMGLDNRVPTSEERGRMEARLDRAMRDGAFGLSSALIYPPASFTTTEELVALARVAAEFDGVYATHVRGETERLPAALDEAVAIGRLADLPVVVYHLKVAARSRWGSMPEVVATIEAARAEGIDVSATVYPYTVAGTSLDACLPDWVHEGGREAMLARLAHPGVRQRIRRDVDEGHAGWENFLRSAGFDGVTIASVSPDGDPSMVGRSLAEIASDRGQDRWDVFFDLLRANRGQVSALYALMHDDDVRVALQQPWVSIGSDSAAQTDDPAQDGRPHPRAFGTFPRVLGHYVREEGVLSLAEAVHRMTGVAARQMRVDDRGEIRAGLFADLVVFDPATVSDRATFDTPRQYPVGIETVIVNGVVALRHGRPTGSRSGRALMGPAVTGVGRRVPVP
jgi:N-acyl-D-amino-acid deacylase